MINSFKTIRQSSEGLYKEKGSKFLAFAHPVTDVEQIKEILKEYRKKYYDARHVCYAYVLGAERAEFRANDDGEPSGTAGRPILGQINSKELTNVLVVVIRYFGGILLGTGGLVVAYKEATADALDQAEIVEQTIEKKLTINFNYSLINDVMRILKETDAQLLSQDFNTDYELIVKISLSQEPILTGKLCKIHGVNYKILE